MYCPNCGHKTIEIDSKFCSNCGKGIPSWARQADLGTTTLIPTGPRKAVNFSDALSTSYWTWRRNPALMVPTMLSTSISVLSQSIYVIFGMALLFQLESNGSISRIASALSASNYGLLEQIIFSPAVFYPVVFYLSCAFIVATVVSIIATGFVLSSEYGSYLIALGGSPVGIGGVMGLLREKWKKMAWTSFVTNLVTFLPIGLAALYGVSILLTAGANLFSILGILALTGLGGLGSVLLSFFLMYSLVSVAFEDVSGLSAIRRSFRQVRNYFGVSFIYAIVRVGSYLLILGVTVAAQYFGVPLSSLASISITLLVVPVLHLSKTAVYRKSNSPALVGSGIYGQQVSPSTSSLRDLLGGPFFRFGLSKLRQGLRELKSFIFHRGNIVYHVSSLLALIVGVLVGSYLAIHGLSSAIFSLGYTPGRINPTILQAVPLSEGFDIFLHNWLVSLSTALSGLWLVAPSLVTLAFNGVILGVVYYLTPNFTMFAAAIFPHGVIEIPAFVLAGSAGVRLGFAFLRTIHGRSKSGTVLQGLREQEASEIDDAETNFRKVARETIYVVIGLAVLFFLAGIIEGNITPVIMRLFGWR